METDEERDARHMSENDRIWGAGNWVRCHTCPHDQTDREVYHHINAHPIISVYFPPSNR